jgi:hypothetical protein
MRDAARAIATEEFFDSEGGGDCASLSTTYRKVN